jgi:hypothetical protein
MARLAQDGPAMAAAIVEGPNCALLVAQNQDRPLADHHRDIAARLWQFAFHAGHQPVLAVNRRHIEVESLLACVKRLRKGVPFAPFFEQPIYAPEFHNDAFLVDAVA